MERTFGNDPTKWQVIREPSKEAIACINHEELRARAECTRPHHPVPVSDGLVGQVYQFGTTRAFLRRFSVKNRLLLYSI